MFDSAYLWTAMHVADEKGAPYTVQPLAYHSPEHFRLHPFGKMPVMQHGDVFLYETAAITHYIDKAFEGPPLQPAGALAQAEVIRWISIINAYIFPIMNRFMKERLVRPLWGVASDEAFIASAHEPLALQMQLIEEAVAARGWLAGEALSLADSFLLPNLLFFGLTREGQALLAKSPATTDWLQRLQARPSFAHSNMSKASSAMAERATVTTQARRPA